MSTRIRYAANPDGSLECLQILKGHTSGIEYKTLISPDGRDGYVLEMPTKAVRMMVTGTSSHKTKIALKRALKALGVVFLNEKRTSKEKA